jgi:endonuclease YncB( thermonuclease family)
MRNPWIVVPSVLLLACALLATTGPSTAEELVGQVSVHDGDTLKLTLYGTSVRLNGIDAPEKDQLCRNEDSEFYPCGEVATKALTDFIAGRDINCVDLDDRSWARTIGVCSVGGKDVADWMVRNGYALDWPKYSKGGYLEPQAEAKRDSRGMWAGSFVDPWKYRACRRAGGKITACSDGDGARP